MLSFLFFQFSWAATAHFFDVGQGHCFLFLTEDRKTAILIDAGSTTNPLVRVPEQEEQQEKDRYGAVEKAISGKLDTTTKLLVIITHPDKDHYNWLKGILEKIINCNPFFKINNTFFIFGGSSKDYTETLPDSVKKQPSPFPAVGKMLNPSFVCDKPQATLSTINAQVRMFLNSSDVSVEILSAYNKAGQKSKNNYSVVTWINFKGKSFLIPGDAEGTITKKLTKQATVLLASHHGSEEDGSNCQDWFNAVAPEYIVFSHGDHCGFRHPHFSVVNRALNMTTVGQAEPHVLFHQTNDVKKPYQELKSQDFSNKGYTFAQIDSKYQLTITNRAVFSTFTQGNIKFKIESDGNMSVQWDKQVNELPKSKTRHDRIAGYLNKTKLAKQITHLWFAGDKVLSEAFLSWDMKQTDMPLLTNVDLSNSNLDKNQTEQIKNLIIQNPQIKNLNLKGNDSLKAISASTTGADAAPPSASPEEQLKQAWGHRGLEIPTAA